MAFSGLGSGTLADPYQITNVNQLQEMKDALSASYILMNNIDASETSSWNGGAGFIPIGNASTPFTGNFNGANYTITNLFMNRTDSRVALFGSIRKSNGEAVSTIKNVYLENVNITSTLGPTTASLVAEIIGHSTSYVVIENCTASGNVHGNSSIGTDGVGGLIGYATRATIANSHSSVNVLDDSGKAGGFIGDSGIVNFSGCSATGQVEAQAPCGSGGAANAGGFVAITSSSSEFEDCFATGQVICSANETESNICIGGFSGRNPSAVNFKRCYATGNVIYNGVSTELIPGVLIGGFAGSLAYDAQCSLCVAKGNVTANTAQKVRIGGFVGSIGEENWSGEEPEE